MPAPPAPIVLFTPAAPAVDATALTPALSTEDVLPFENAPAAPPPSSGDEPHPELGGTALVEALVLADVLPFKSDDPSSSPRLTLEQYASFTVERDLYPARVAETRARYGLADAAAEADNDRHWSARAAADAVTRSELDGKCAAYRQWLSGRRSS
jgi:hypothetical protein